jgi:probable rRNA maturation factor
MSLPESPTATGVGSALELEVDIEPGVHVEWDRPTIERLVHSLVERHLPPGEYTLALHLVGDQTIRELNHEHRAKDARTDVLSFPLHDPSGMRFVLPPGQPINLGDVVVAYPRVLAQAAEFGHSAARELGYLVAHGVLHVLGFDHEREADRRRMRQAEEEALAALGLTR